jgi:chemotaxis protein CheD
LKLAEPKLPVVFLKAGELYVSPEPSVVVTVLGSCLSVTMYHARTGLGGICHGLLPKCEGPRRCGVDCTEATRYVDCAINRMLARFDRRGIERSEIEVKCFGGADMFSRPIEKPGLASVGRQNIATAEQVLSREGLKPHVVDVGGLRGRKLFFYTHTGEVYLKRLQRGEVREPVPGDKKKERTNAPRGFSHGE